MSAAAWEFFYHQAGWGYRPGRESELVGKLLGADKLARAELWARENDAAFVWEDDCELAEVYNEETDNYDKLPAVVCIMYLPCDKCPDGDILNCERKYSRHIATSVCGVIESDDSRERNDYRRVLEAELALEVEVMRS